MVPANYVWVYLPTLFIAEKNSTFHLNFLNETFKPQREREGERDKRVEKYVLKSS